MRAVFELQLRLMVGDKKWAQLGLFACIPLLLSTILRIAGAFVQDPPPEVGLIFHFLLYPQIICVLMTMFYASTTLTTELQGRTIAYLFTRPMPRWHVLLAKYAAVLVSLAPPVMISLFFSWLAWNRNGGFDLLLTMWGMTIVSLLAYGALFTLIGALIPEKAIVVCLIYAIIEFLISLFPALLNTFTVSYFLRSLAIQVMDIVVPSEAQWLFGAGGLPSIGKSIFGLVTFTAVSLLCASAVTHHREFVTASRE